MRDPASAGRARRRVAVVVLAVALGQPVGARQAPTPTPQQALREREADGIILGRAVDADTGQPIAGALVRLTTATRAAPGTLAARARPEPQAVLTTQSGRFVLRGLPAGSYTLTAVLAGYANATYGQARPDGPSRAVLLEPDERVKDVEIRMWRLASVSGRVVDEAGEPAVGVTVRALRRTRQGLVPSDTASADDRGVYRLATLIPGDYLIAVPSTATTVPESAAGEYRQAVAEGRSSQLLRERMASRAPSPATVGIPLEGLVLQLAAGAAGRGLVPPQPQPGGPVLLYRTVFHPSATSAAEATVISVGSGEERTGVDIALQLVPTVSLSGVVTGPDGPAQNMGVHVSPASLDPFSSAMSPLETATTMTDAGGQFTVLGVPAGEYVVSVLRVPRPALPTGVTTVISTSGGGISVSTSGSLSATPAPTPPPAEPTLWAYAPVTVGSTDIDDLRLELRTGISLTGRVMFDGTSPPPAAERLPSLMVRLAPTETPPVSAISPARPDAEGRFVTVGYPPGRYRVQVTGLVDPAWSLQSVTLDGRDVTVNDFDLAADAKQLVITMTDRPSGLSGTVTAPPGASLRGAAVVLLPADVRGWTERGMPAAQTSTASVTESGAYRFGRILPGDYLAAALAESTGVNLQDPNFVAALARVATRVTVAEGQQAVLPLSVVTIR